MCVRAARRALLVLLTVLAAAVPARASFGPSWSDDQLVVLSEFIVRGRVVSIVPGWDPGVEAIYTYVAVDVIESLKGSPGAQRIVLKQLGGELGGLGLRVIGQARFVEGEDVLLFLEVRPRDGTLQTTALAQGKWTVRREAGVDLVMGERTYAYEGLRTRIRAAAAAAPDAPHSPVQVVPVEAPRTPARQPFTLIDPAEPLRWTSFPLPVDVEHGGQPGLPGGGLGEIQWALSQWTTSGADVQLVPGVARAAKCTRTNENSGRVVISFMDDCQEMSNDGGTLALGGAWYLTTGGGTVNGVNFGRALDGFVMNNDSPAALQYLTRSGCFAEIQLHELGHVLGLGHSEAPGALMQPTISSACGSGPRGLQADDLQGIRFIYPGVSPPPAGSRPANVQVVVHGTSTISVSWTGVAGVSGYRLDFRQAGQSAVAASVSTAATSTTVAIPPGVTGSFTVTVIPIAGNTPGTPSDAVPFTIGGGTTCAAAPAAPSGLTGSVSGGVARVSWSPVPGATSYVLRAGSASGVADLFNANVGATTSVQAPAGAGFFAYVRVYAVNACGESAGSVELLVR